MRRFFSWRGAAVLAIAALAACDSPIEAPEQQPEDLAAMVEALGFRGDMVQDFGDYVLVEGDIHLTKAELRRAQPRGADPLGPRFQYRSTNTVGSPKVYDITVDVSGLASEPGWQTAAREALTHWSGITGSYVRMVEGGPADITFTTNCTSSNIAASAPFPSGGNPGSAVYVNTCFAYSTSHAQKVHNMVHELGHTLGFRHSNYTQLGESAGTTGAIRIPGTPTSGNAPGSVMNGGTALNSWAGFSSHDLVATRYLYGLPAVGFGVEDSGGNPLLTWAAPAGASGYTVRLLIYITRNGNLESQASTGVGSTTGTSLLDIGAAYTGQTECSYVDFDGSIVGAWYEYELTAQFANGTSSTRASAPVAQEGCGTY